MCTYLSLGVGLITSFNSTHVRDLCTVCKPNFVQIAQLKLFSALKQLLLFIQKLSNKLPRSNLKHKKNSQKLLKVLERCNMTFNILCLFIPILHRICRVQNSDSPPIHHTITQMFKINRKSQLTNPLYYHSIMTLGYTEENGAI